MPLSNLKEKFPCVPILLFMLKVSTPYFDSFMSFSPKNICEDFLPRHVLIVEKS